MAKYRKKVNRKFTYELRKELERLIGEGYSVYEITDIIDASPSAIYYEIHRVTRDVKAYSAEAAQRSL